MRTLNLIFATALMAGLVGCTTTAVLSPSSSKSSQSKYKSVNDVRRSFGLSALETDARLQRMANEQARFMARSKRMKHTAVAGQTFTRRLKRSGYPGLAAENIAEGYQTKGETMDAWVRFRPHRKNMLNRRMKRYGLGVVETDHPRRGRRKYWTLILGG
mgnify:CR=1 FL=1